MSAYVNIRCHSCIARNRVDIDRATKAVCGRCGKRLLEVGNAKEEQEVIDMLFSTHNSLNKCINPKEQQEITIEFE